MNIDKCYMFNLSLIINLLNVYVDIFSLLGNKFLKKSKKTLDINKNSAIFVVLK